MFGEDRTITSAAIILILVTATGSLIAGAYVTKPEPEFEMSNLTVSSSEAVPGENVTISVDVKNVGKKEGTCTVKFKIDGIIENSQTITLPKGGTESVSFTLQRENKKSYSIEVGNLFETFSVVKPPEFEVSDLVISSRPSAESEMKTITSDDFKNWRLNENLRLKGSADHDYEKSRINLIGATWPSIGVVVDDAFSNTLENWEWKGNAIMGGGSVHVIFYADGETISGEDNTEEVRNGYFLCFSGYENKIRFMGVRDGETKTIGSTDYAFGKEERYELGLKFEKGTVKTYIDGTKELSRTIDQPDYTYGGFTISGLRDSSSENVYLLDYCLSRIRHLRLIDISAKVSNIGEKFGTYEAKLEINGEIENVQNVDLDAGETTTVSFSALKSERRTYTVRIENLIGTFEVDW